jgi:hypothetical protein
VNTSKPRISCSRIPESKIWIAVSVYVLVAIVKKRLSLEQKRLYTILQILSVALFEKTTILQVLADSDYT